MEDIIMIKQLLLKIIFLILIQILTSSNYSMSIDVPQLINYQGIITDTNGKTFNGQKTITFNIYDASGTNA